MKTFFVVVIFTVVLSVATAATPFQLCSGEAKDALVTSIVIPNCNAPPCEAKRGANVSVTIGFTSTKAFTSLTNKVYGEIAGVDVAFPGYPSSAVDVCKLGVTCPTKAGVACKEVVSLPVSTSFPKISLTAKWKLESDGNTVGCFEVPLKVD